MKNFDLIVVGAGLIGLSTAFRAQTAGARVLVIDRGGVGYEASSRAEGFLSLRGETPAECQLAQMAEKMWPALAQELGHPTEWVQKGRIWPAFSPDEVTALRAKFAIFQTTDIPFQFVEGEDCRKLAPALSPKVLAAIHTSRSGHANPQRVVQAFAWAFEDKGGTILENTPVIALTERSGKIVGVKTANGQIDAPCVIACAGGYNAQLLKGLGIVFPSAPFRVESFVTTPMPPLFDMCFVGRGISVRQTQRGNFHVQGGPYEWVDLQADREPAKPVTPVICRMARRFSEAFPAAVNTRMLRAWGGITETTPDQMVIIERFSTPAGLLAASGGGHGFGMSPVMGVALSELALEGTTRAPVGALGLSRFGNISSDWRVERGWQAGAYNS